MNFDPKNKVGRFGRITTYIIYVYVVIETSVISKEGKKDELTKDIVTIYIENNNNIIKTLRFRLAVSYCSRSVCVKRLTCLLCCTAFSNGIHDNVALYSIHYLVTHNLVLIASNILQPSRTMSLQR